MESMKQANHVDACRTEFQIGGEVNISDPALRSMFNLMASFEQQSAWPTPEFAAL